MKLKEVHIDRRSAKQRRNAKATLEAWGRLGLLFTHERTQHGCSFEERKLREIATSGSLKGANDIR